jgi:predicted PurR-regulated permease PerM
MKKAIGLDPVVIIIALIVGASLFGFLGMLIAIPFTSALTVIIKEFQEKGLPE